MPARKRSDPAVKNPNVQRARAAAAGDAGLSLDELSAALAGMLDAGDDPYSAPKTGDAPTAAGLAEDLATADATAAANDRSEISPRSILEAMLFVGSPGSEPLTSKQVAGLMRGVRPAEIDALVRELNETYERRNCPYTIAAEGKGYRLMLRERHARLRDRFYGKARMARLSQAAIEVLAAVAYNAPITLDEISRIRGTPSGHIVTQLVRRQLLALDRDPASSRRSRYSTTERFLALFGLESLADLPRSHESLEG
jgi:segregation and condensation protein B